MLEEQLKRIADSLEAIANGLSNKGGFITGPPQTAGGEAPAPVKPRTSKKTATPVPAHQPDPAAEAVTKDDLTDMLREVVRVKSADVAKGVLAKFGADRISAVDEAQYPKLYNELKTVAGG